MRMLSYFQEEINYEEVIENNELFAFYLKELVKEFTKDEEYNIINAQYDDFIIPGRLELKIDEYEACIDLSSDVLAAIYQIVLIRNEALKNQLKNKEDVDLRNYF